MYMMCIVHSVCAGERIGMVQGAEGAVNIG